MGQDLGTCELFPLSVGDVLHSSEEEVANCFCYPVSLVWAVSRWSSRVAWLVVFSVSCSMWHWPGLLVLLARDPQAALRPKVPSHCGLSWTTCWLPRTSISPQCSVFTITIPDHQYCHDHLSVAIIVITIPPPCRHYQHYVCPGDTEGQIWAVEMGRGQAEAEVREENSWSSPAVPTTTLLPAVKKLGGVGLMMLCVKLLLAM